MAKEWAKGFYNSGAWASVREAVLKRDRYMCVRCHAPAITVHHKTRLSKDNINDPSISLNPSNLETLCDECHKAEHKNERVKAFARSDEHARIAELIKPDYEFDAEGNLIPPGGSENTRGSQRPMPAHLSN